MAFRRSGAALAGQVWPRPCLRRPGDATVQRSAAQAACSNPAAVPAPRHHAHPHQQRQRRCLSTGHGRSLASVLPSWPGLPVAEGNRAGSGVPLPTHVTTLSNGLRVASEDLPGPWCSLGVLIDCGPRYETQANLGTTHFIDRLAFKSTQANSHEELIQRMQALGGDFSCSSNRETMMYLGNVFRSDAGKAMELLADTVLRPAMSAAEVSEQQTLVEYEAEDLLEAPAHHVIELLYDAAYRGQTLGQPHLCSPDNASRIGQSQLAEYRDQFYIPARTVIAASGIRHEVLVELAEQYFGERVFPAREDTVVKTAAVYTGGTSMYKMDESPSNNPLGIPLTHFALGFKGVSWNDPDIFAVAVLQVLLGGGSSFSSGGPGKGMYSRLYSRVLCLYRWFDSALATNLSFTDGGVFVLQGSAPPERLSHAVTVLVSELMMVANAVDPVELARARTQLKSSLMMNLESRIILMEDIGRQLVSSDKRLSAEELCNAIDAVTAEDVVRVTRNMLQHPPSVSAVGNVDTLPSYDALCEGLRQMNDSLKQQ